MALRVDAECSDSDSSEGQGDILENSPHISRAIERLVQGPELAAHFAPYSHSRQHSTEKATIDPIAAGAPPSPVLSSAVRAPGAEASFAGPKPDELGAPLEPTPTSSADGVQATGFSNPLDSNEELVGTLREIIKQTSHGSLHSLGNEDEAVLSRRSSWADISKMCKRKTTPDATPRSPNHSRCHSRCQSFTVDEDVPSRVPSRHSTDPTEDQAVPDLNSSGVRGNASKTSRFGPTLAQSVRTQPLVHEEDEDDPGWEPPRKCDSQRSSFAESVPAERDADATDEQHVDQDWGERVDATAGGDNTSPRDADCHAHADATASGEGYGGSEAAGANASSEHDEAAPVTIQGTLLKKRPKLTKTSKVMRLLRREAQELLSQSDDWLAGLGSIQTDKVKGLAREVFGLIRGQEPSVSTDAVENKDEDTWDPRYVQLFHNGMLAWSKPPSEEHGIEDPSLTVTALGSLSGSSVEYLGMHHEKDMHMLRIFPAPKVRRQPLTFAVRDATEAGMWISSLRDACAFPLPIRPRPRPGGRFDYLVELWEGIGPPPECEAPCAVLRLEVVSISGLSADVGGSAKDGRLSRNNLYVLGCLRGRQFRTVTRYGPGDGAHFGQTFSIPIDLEDPDTPVTFEVFNEPEYDDQEPVLIGGITVPLFVFGRQQARALVLTLTQASETRRGVVNASLRNLVIRGTLEQPMGHLFLPVELPQHTSNLSEESSKELKLEALEKQVNRISALILVVVGWVDNVAFVLQWERFWLSVFWLVFMEMWMLVLWRWSLTIVGLLLLRRAVDLRPRRKPETPEEALRIEALPASAVGAEFNLPRPDRQSSMPPARAVPLSPRSKMREMTSPLRNPDSEDTGEKLIWEHERRIVFGGFSAEYLLEGIDPPQWTDVRGWEASGPVSTIWEDNIPYSYQWKVVVDENTDENGWQYAFHFTKDATWCRIFDTMQTWVRARQRRGWRVRRLSESSAPAPAEACRQGRADPEVTRQSAGPHQVEATISENDLYRRYTQLYLSIQSIIDFWVTLLEKYKNTITWKDETVTGILVILLTSIVLLSFVVPTRLVFAGIVALSFYIGSLMGRRHRGNRAAFLNSLNAWCIAMSQQELSLSGADRCSKVDECGITRLDVRNWCNSTYRVQLDLRSVDSCGTLKQLADLVIEASSQFEKTPRRYRSWHSDPYNNFLDHVPSDATENEVGSFCYKTCAASSLPAEM